MRTLTKRADSRSEISSTSECRRRAGAQVVLEGYLVSIRRLGGASFLQLRDSSGVLQVVVEERKVSSAGVIEGSAVRVRGRCRSEPRAPAGFEVQAAALELLSAGQAPAVPLGKPRLGLSLQRDIELRPLSLRHSEHWHRFKIQAALAAGFRAALAAHGCVEIFSPKLVSGNAEGGADYFSLEYFGREAALAQSPQLYKQIMVGVYGRVFEIGHVYRAEQHNSSRHLNEYVSLDFEVGFINGLDDLMELQAQVLSSMLQQVREECPESAAALNCSHSDPWAAPVLQLQEALELIEDHSGVRLAPCGGLNSRGERLLGAAVAERFASEFVFVTNYSTAERPFYAAEDELNRAETQSFDLLFRGCEITTGGVRINCPRRLREKLAARGLCVEPFKHYLAAFDGGLPPHGGSGTGLERFTALLTGADNIRAASLFPRDMTRLEP